MRKAIVRKSGSRELSKSARAKAVHTKGLSATPRQFKKNWVKHHLKITAESIANGRIEIDLRFGNRKDSRAVYEQTYIGLVESFFRIVNGCYPLLSINLEIIKGDSL